jgi:anti-anti-sigma factor
MKSRLRWSLQVSAYDLPGAQVVVLSGRVGSTTTAELEAALDRLNSGHSTRVLIDLAGVDYISSAGLLVIERAAGRARAAGGALLVCGLQEAVQVSLEVSGAAARLDIAESVAEATGRLGTVP